MSNNKGNGDALLGSINHLGLLWSRVFRPDDVRDVDVANGWRFPTVNELLSVWDFKKLRPVDGFEENYCLGNFLTSESFNGGTLVVSFGLTYLWREFTAVIRHVDLDKESRLAFSRVYVKTPNRL